MYIYVNLQSARMPFGRLQKFARPSAERFKWLCMCAYIKHVCVSRMYVCIHACVMYVCECVWMYACMYACMYVCFDCYHFQQPPEKLLKANIHTGAMHTNDFNSM
jgi:hypothetical protein